MPEHKPRIANSERKRRGQVPLYDPARHPALAAALAAQGKIDTEISDLLQIKRKTLWAWRKRYPEFDAAVADGKDVADEQVKASLFKRANGYEYEETEITVSPGESSVSTRKVRKIKKHIPPDTTACIFWLKNRRPDEWHDVQRVAPTTPDGKNPYVGMDDETLLAIAQRIVRNHEPAGDA
jgi:hypothetical protein